MKRVLGFVEQLENARNPIINWINAPLRRGEIKSLVKGATKNHCNFFIVAFNKEQENTLKSAAPEAAIINNEPLSYREYKEISKAAFSMTWMALRYPKIREKLNINSIDFSKAMAHYLTDETVQVMRIALIIKKTIQKNKPDIVVAQSKNYRIGCAAAAVALSENTEFSSYDSAISGLKKRARNYIGRKMYFEKELYMRNAELFFIGGSGRKMLIDSRYINHLRSIKPVADILRKKYALYVFSFQKDVERAFGFAERIQFKIRNAAAGIDMRNLVMECENDRNFRRIFRFHGIDLWNSMKDNYYYIFSEGLNKLIEETSISELFLRDFRPDAIIVGDDRAIGTRCHVLAAKKLGIKTADIQHGLDPDIAAMDTPISDILLVGGQYSKKHIIEFGAKPENIKVVGWPQYDSLAGEKIFSARHMKTMLFAPDASYPFQNVEVMKLLQHSITKEQTLIVKPHPFDDEALYRKTAVKNNVFVVGKKENVIKYIKESDVVITAASTVGLEALLLGKPVVIINLEKEVNTGYVYTSCGTALEITNPADVKRIAGLIEKNTGRMRKKIPAFVKLHAYRMDGKSSERAANEIEKMIV